MPTDVLTQIFPVHIVCPTPAIAGLHTVCSNASNPLTVNDGTGGTFPTIKWTTPTATNLTAASVSALQSGTYTATVTGATGCTASTSFAVVVNAAPLPTLTGNDFFCTQNAPLSTTLTVSAAFSSYNWSGTPVNTTNSLTANTAGNYTVTVIDANGCTGVTTKTVRASTITNLAITGNTSFCAGSSTTLICVVGTPNVNFIWNTLNTGTSTTASAAGNYCVTATNADGCSTSTCQTVSSIALPTPTISGGNHLLCANSTTNTLSVSGGVFSLVKWERPDHSLLTATTLPAALQNGIYTVTVTGTGGCTATATFDVTVDIVPTISLTSSLSSICAGGTAVLTASGASTFTWSQGGNTPTVSVSPTITTIYTVTATNNGICSTTKSITVTVNAAPGSITFEPTLLCVNGAANIGIIPESANNTYTWSTGETGLSITIAAAGIYTATVTNVNGCTNTGSIPMVTVVPPVSYAGRDTTIELGQSVQLFGQVISSPYPNVEYHWEANHGTVATYSQNPLVTPTETTIYTFHIHTVPGECESDETELTVTVLKRLGCLSPDEGFTPNGDGKNDTWTIPCLQDEPNFMEIYNRWGESIFKATNYYNTFDGKLNGQLLPDGTYYYVVKAQSRNFKGTVTILR